ncbi:MAG: rod shape-determining protein MreC [Acidobacteria bacterium]|nr:rod shape-determining protein MreC [Acidobacteriota bacterium]MCL5287864.1 rod shape-determining protein MreC [Acidobacteriota bacterium]
MRVIQTVKRPLILLATVVLAQVLLLAFQIKRGEVRLIRVAALWVVSPVQRGGTSLIDGVAGAWNRYVGLRNARQENEVLRKELADLKLRMAQLEGNAAEAKRLQALLAFREANADVPMVAARVVGAGASDTSRTVYIDRGEADKIRKNMGVITPDGVVGKVLETFPKTGTSLVLLLTDKESGAGALLANSRTFGIIRGTGEPTVELRNVSNDQDVAIGETVLTSGLDQIFPKDLPLGTVVSAEKGNPFKVIRVKTAARLDRLEEVLVLLTQHETPGKKEDATATPPKQ